MRRNTLVLLSLLFLATCGNRERNRVALDKNLVGSWALEGTDLVDVIIAGLEKSMFDAGVGRYGRGAVITEVRNSWGNLLPVFRSTNRFNADGSFEDDQGNSGIWRVEGNTLTMVVEGDIERVSKYFVDGDDLTLIYSFEWLLETLREAEAIPAEDLQSAGEALEALGIGEDTNARFFYKRK